MNEHKKMYKAGKRWLVATLAVASVAVGTAVVSGQPAVHAATVDNVTQSQQAANTDPRITVVSGDQNQGQRNQYQQQAQDLQQQVADRNASLEQVNGQLSQYQQEQAAADTAIKNDQAQLDQGKQLMDQAVQAKTAWQSEILQQHAQVLAELNAQRQKTQELKAQADELRTKKDDLSKQCNSIFDQVMKETDHTVFVKLNEQYKQLSAKEQEAEDAYNAAFEQQIASVNKTNQIGEKSQTLLDQLVALKKDPNPYLPADKESYERGQQLVADFTKQLASDQQKKASLANRIRGMQRQLQLIGAQRDQYQQELDAINSQLQALPAVYQVEKKITRTIVLNQPNGAHKMIQQQAKITGTKTVINGQTSYSNWSQAEWPAFVAEELPGYQVPTLAAQTVDSSTPDQQLELTYQPQEPTNPDRGGNDQQSNGVDQADKTAQEKKTNSDQQPTGGKNTGSGQATQVKGNYLSGAKQDVLLEPAAHRGGNGTQNTQLPQTGNQTEALPLAALAISAGMAMFGLALPRRR